MLLRSAIAALAGGVTLLDVTLDFDYAVLVGIGIGTVVGFAAVRVRARIGQPTLTTAISFTVPLLAFFPAEALHGSGVLAVVVAGLITGFTATRHLTPQDRISERMNWRTIQLMLENGVFLAMGYQLLHVAEEVAREGGDLWGTIWVGLAVTAALILVRILFAGPLSVWLRFEQRRATRRLADTGRDKSARWRHVLRLPHAGKGSQRRRADWRVLAAAA
ncbi:cation:proton antiporter, partial [Saccharopolyspora sp. 6M]|uniref:cation:proton antiporter domain-containing protein n=1 Tax=Saccharopolyspora sp. 6M TaxID=2877237 RepID=UPI0027DEF32D